MSRKKTTSWRYVCLSCDMASRPMPEREKAQGYGEFHKDSHGHQVLLHGEVRHPVTDALLAAAGKAI